MSAQPNRFRDAPGAAYSLSTPAPIRMDYFKLSKRFWQLDSERSFGASATRLYFFLLEEFNREFWPEQYTLSDAQLCLVLDMTANTLKKARLELTARAGLHCKAGQQGRNLKAVYSLSLTAEKVSKNDTYGTTSPRLKVSANVSKNDSFPSNKVSDKVSKNDTLYKEETINSSVVETENKKGADAPAPAAGISSPVQAKESHHPEDPAASASHTRAAALLFPEWATDTFRAEWAQWLAFRQGKRDKLKPISQQKLLDKLAQFDEGFCLLLFDKAISNGYTGLVFDDTPAKFAHYLASKPENAHVNGSHHVFGANQATRYGQRSPASVSTAASGCSPLSLAIAGALAAGTPGPDQS